MTTRQYIAKLLWGSNPSLARIQSWLDQVVDYINLLMTRTTSLPEYANNAAALAGGLVAGDYYRTSTGVVMVVY